MSKILFPLQRKSVGEKFDWQHSLAHHQKLSFRRKNPADISYTDQVLSKISFHGNGCRSENMQFAAFNDPSSKPPFINAKISQTSFMQAELWPILSQISLPWQRVLVGEKCNWQHSMAYLRKPPYRRKNLLCTAL